MAGTPAILCGGISGVERRRRGEPVVGAGAYGNVDCRNSYCVRHHRQIPKLYTSAFASRVSTRTCARERGASPTSLW